MASHNHQPTLRPPHPDQAREHSQKDRQPTGTRMLGSPIANGPLVSRTVHASRRLPCFANDAWNQPRQEGVRYLTPFTSASSLLQVEQSSNSLSRSSRETSQDNSNQRHRIMKPTTSLNKRGRTPSTTPRKPRKRRGREEFPHVPRICSLDPAAINRCTTSKMDATAGSLGSPSSTVSRQLCQDTIMNQENLGRGAT